MMNAFADTPVVMCISHHDPSGSTGIQADIETISSLGGHATSIVTALCAKDTHEAKEIIPVGCEFLIEQCRAILEDMPVKAIKLGFTGSVENIEAIHSILIDYPNIPVVLDPVTSLGQDTSVMASSLRQALQTLILPLATIMTADIVEAHELAQQADTLHACAQEILETGCENLLVSGAKRSHEHYENYFFDRRGLVQPYRWPRLQQFSHGCGSTLSASIACYLAHDLLLSDAIQQGQRFTWESLSNSRRLGMGKRTPNRFFWTQQDK